MRVSTKGLPPAVRAHIAGRFLSCPFRRLLARVPAGADILDIGSGHGLFGRLALLAGARSVTGVEPDVDKVRVGLAHPRMRTVCGYDQAVSGRFDVVSLVDVLYRVPIEEWDALFARTRDRLRGGGMLIVKDLDPTAPLKSGWNRLQETISDRLLHLTLGTAFSYEPPHAIVARLTRSGFSTVTVERIDAGYPHAHVLIRARG